jgi:SGNH hydrolase-like domain, acetyltransferase AlgX
MRRYLQTFFALTTVALIITWVLSYWQRPLSGDLTRIGFYSERDYGWNAQQTQLNIAATGAAVIRPDFWVLGDSFSIGNQWQSVIGEQGQLRSQTFHYDKIGCVSQWIDQAAKHPSIRTVVLEVAQISLLTRFAKIADCGNTPNKPIEVVARRALTEPITDFNPSTDWRIKHSALTQLNTWQISRQGAQTLRDDQVANSSLKPNCANFSNQRHDRLLYQTGSLDHPNKTAKTYAQAAANLLNLQKQAEAHGKKFLLVVIPDKFSAYQSCITDTEASTGQAAVSTCNYLSPEGVTCLNLMPLIDSERLKTRDLYLPNDSHFSNAGYRLLANAVAPYLR